MATLTETKRKKYHEGMTALEDFFKKNTNDKGEYTFTADQLPEVNRRNNEVAELKSDYEKARDVDEIKRKNLQNMDALEGEGGDDPGMKFGIDTKGMGTDGARTTRHSAIGDLFVKSADYKGRHNGGRRKEWGVELAGVETKTVFSTTAGWDPFVTRLPRVQLSPQQVPKIIDAFSTGTTKQHSIKYMLETLYTNAAAETAEGGYYPEAALKLTEQNISVNKLSVFLPVTDEQLEDEEQARDYLNTRMDLMLRQRLDSQLINGNGTAPNLTGLANTSGLLTYARASNEPDTDALLKGITLVRTTGFVDPTHIVMNPNDFTSIRLMRTADGLYIWGHPSMPGPGTIWGLPVIESMFVTQGTSYTGDFRGQAMVFFRKGIEFLVSNSHADWFQAGKLAVRADFRVALVVFRAPAFCAISNEN